MTETIGFTIYRIAREAGVQPGSVRLHLTGRWLPEWSRRRVEQAIHKLTGRRN